MSNVLLRYMQNAKIRKVCVRVQYLMQQSIGMQGKRRLKHATLGACVMGVNEQRSMKKSITYVSGCNIYLNENAMKSTENKS